MANSKHIVSKRLAELWPLVCRSALHDNRNATSDRAVFASGGGRVATAACPSAPSTDQGCSGGPVLCAGPAGCGLHHSLGDGRTFPGIFASRNGMGRWLSSFMWTRSVFFSPLWQPESAASYCCIPSTIWPRMPRPLAFTAIIQRLHCRPRQLWCGAPTCSSSISGGRSPVCAPSPWWASGIKNKEAVEGARKVLLMTHLAGYGLLAAILVIYSRTGSSSLDGSRGSALVYRRASSF